MKEEIYAAVSFLTRLVGKSGTITADQVEVFQQSLGTILTERFKDHWFPEKPFKGQAYRCIRVNETERRDPVLEQAAEMCGLQYENLGLPVELTIWVDPQEVCCRFGEQEGSYCTVASFKNNKENLIDCINFEECCQKLPLNQEFPENQKKQKTKRKFDRQKKQIPQSFVNQQNVLRDLPIKAPILNMKTFPSTHPIGCLQWNPTPLMMTSRFGRVTPTFYSQDTAFSQRPKKQFRSFNQNDRFPLMCK